MYTCISVPAQSVFICWGVVLVSALKGVCVGGDAEKRGRNEYD